MRFLYEMSPSQPKARQEPPARKTMYAHCLHMADIDLISQNIREYDLGKVLLSLIAIKVAL
jgi:hypothetical protein